MKVLPRLAEIADVAGTVVEIAAGVVDAEAAVVAVVVADGADGEAADATAVAVTEGMVVAVGGTELFATDLHESSQINE